MRRISQTFHVDPDTRTGELMDRIRVLESTGACRFGKVTFREPTIRHDGMTITADIDVLAGIEGA